MKSTFWLNCVALSSLVPSVSEAAVSEASPAFVRRIAPRAGIKRDRHRHHRELMLLGDQQHRAVGRAPSA